MNEILFFRQILKELFGKRTGRIVKFLSWVWRHTFARLGEDWVYLALLGIIMALISYVMDKGIAMCTNGQLLTLIYSISSLVIHAVYS